jgi:beta-xylosidase
VRALSGTVSLALLLASSSAAQEAGGAPDCPGSSGQGLPTRALGAVEPHLILNQDFPDPFVARFDKNYQAYATGVSAGGVQLNVQRIQSADLRNWSRPTEALPNPNFPAWVDRAHPQVWAPEVLEINGRYVLYFNARHSTLTRVETPSEGPRVLKRHCLGAAVSDRPEGPFTGIDEPLVCNEFEEGVIDAGIFRDGDSLYLFYKHDGNCCGRKTAIYAQGLSPDGLAALGPRHKLIENNDSPAENDDWEWWVVEAPTMVKRRGAYFLFYSGNYFGNKNYSVAYLRCTSPRGPCTDPGENPILWSHPSTPLVGPGHQSILEEEGRSLVFFHGWNRDPDGKQQAGVHKRCLYVSRINWVPAPAGGERPIIVGGEPPEG